MRQKCVKTRHLGQKLTFPAHNARFARDAGDGAESRGTRSRASPTPAAKSYSHENAHSTRRAVASLAFHASRFSACEPRHGCALSRIWLRWRSARCFPTRGFGLSGQTRFKTRPWAAPPRQGGVRPKALVPFLVRLSGPMQLHSLHWWRRKQCGQHQMRAVRPGQVHPHPFLSSSVYCFFLACWGLWIFIFFVQSTAYSKQNRA